MMSLDEELEVANVKKPIKEKWIYCGVGLFRADLLENHSVFNGIRMPAYLHRETPLSLTPLPHLRGPNEKTPEGVFSFALSL